MTKRKYEAIFGRRTIIFLCVIFFFKTVVAQDIVTNQLWTEAFVNYSFANAYKLENSVAYRTTLPSSGWHTFSFRPTLVRDFTQNIDGQAALTLSYVAQNDTSNTFEIRPMLGSRVHLTPNRRVLMRILFRFEQRNFLDTETKDWSQSARFRVRPEIIIPLNRKSYFENDQWYALVDAEWFFTAGEDVEERFANRFRLRMGGGYRLNATWRFELLYTKQEAKNKIEEDFYTSDNIWRIRLKYFVNRTKHTSTTTPSGSD